MLTFFTKVPQVPRIVSDIEKKALNTHVSNEGTAIPLHDIHDPL